MEAVYKGKNIVYDIDTNSYSDDFSTSFKRELDVCDLISKKSGRDYLTSYCENIYNDWHKEVRYYTDFVMTLNHKAWAWYEKDKKLSGLYAKLYEKYYNKGFKLFKDNDLKYYIGILD